MTRAGRLSPRLLVWGLCCAAAFAAAVWRLRAYTPDDAFITFSYAQRYAAGDGWVASANAPPVEGFSSPLWTGLLEVAARLGCDLVITAKWVSALCGVGLVLATLRLAHAARGSGGTWAYAAPFLLATWPPLALWTASGMENALYGFLLVMGTLGVVDETWGGRRSWRSAGWWVAAVWCRPEAFGLAAFAAAWRVTAWRAQRRPTVVWCGVLLAGVAAVVAWRYASFGEWLPNTYYAKRNNLLIGKGWAYLGAGAWQAGFGAVAALAAVPAVLRLAQRGHRLWHPTWCLTSLVAAQCVFVVQVGGDWMHQFRFLTPLAPWVCVLAADGVAGMSALLRTRRRGLGVAVGVLAATAWAASWPRAWREARLHRSVDIVSEVWAPYRTILHQLANALGPGATLVIPELGYPSYATDLRILDPLGLASAHVAHVRYERVDRLLRDVWRPDAIKVHSLVRQALHLDHDRWFRDSYMLLWGPPDWETRPEAMDGWYVRRDLFEHAPQEFLPAQVTYGGALELRDVRFQPAALRPGQTVRLHLAWRVAAVPGADWRYRLWIRSPDGAVTHHTRGPLHDWLPMNAWPPQKVIADRIDIGLDDTASVGTYDVGLTLHVGDTTEAVSMSAPHIRLAAGAPFPLGSFEVVTQLTPAQVNAAVEAARALENMGDPQGAWERLAPLRALAQQSIGVDARIAELDRYLALQGVRGALAPFLAGSDGTFGNVRAQVARIERIHPGGWAAIRSEIADGLLERMERENDTSSPWRQIQLASLAGQVDPTSRRAGRVYRGLWEEAVLRERAARDAVGRGERGLKSYERSGDHEQSVGFVGPLSLRAGTTLDARFAVPPVTGASPVPQERLLQLLMMGPAGYRVATIPLAAPASAAIPSSVKIVVESRDTTTVLRVEAEQHAPRRFVLGPIGANPWAAPRYPPQPPTLLALALLPSTGGNVGQPYIPVDVRYSVVTERGQSTASGWQSRVVWFVAEEGERVPDILSVRAHERLVPLAD